MKQRRRGRRTDLSRVKEGTDAVGYQCFGGPCCLHLHPEDILPHHYTASQPRRPRLQSSPPLKPQISQSYFMPFPGVLFRKPSPDKNYLGLKTPPHLISHGRKYTTSEHPLPLRLTGVFKNTMRDRRLR